MHCLVMQIKTCSWIQCTRIWTHTSYLVQRLGIKVPQCVHSLFKLYNIKYSNLLGLRWLFSFVLQSCTFWCVVDTSRWINFSLLDQFIWLIFHLFCNHTLDQCCGKYLCMCTHVLIVDTNCLLHLCPVRNQEHVAGMPSMRPCSTSLSWLGTMYLYFEEEGGYGLVFGCIASSTGMTLSPLGSPPQTLSPTGMVLPILLERTLPSLSLLPGPAACYLGLSPAWLTDERHPCFGLASGQQKLAAAVRVCQCASAIWRYKSIVSSVTFLGIQVLTFLGIQVLTFFWVFKCCFGKARNGWYIDGLVNHDLLFHFCFWLFSIYNASPDLLCDFA
jgi:hypothetical protein